MEESMRVRGVEGIGHLSRDLERLADGHRTVTDALGQGGAVDELQDERQLPCDILEPEDRADVRMIERRQRPRLVGKAARDVDVVAERRVQQLDGDGPAKARVASAVDCARAALTEPAGDLEYADAIALDQWWGCCRADILITPANGSRHFRELSGGGVCLEERRHLAVQAGVFTTQPPEQRGARLPIAFQDLMEHALHALPVHGAHTISSRQRKTGESVNSGARIVARPQQNGTAVLGPFMHASVRRYVGYCAWNRLRYVRNPDTARRMSRLNPTSEWMSRDVADLRIVPDDIWTAANPSRDERCGGDR